MHHVWSFLIHNFPIPNFEHHLELISRPVILGKHLTMSLADLILKL